MDQNKTPNNTPESPYINARREWNERYGGYVAQANNWRIAALGSMTVALVATAGLVWISGQHKVVPYAIEFNQHGEVIRVARADLAARPNMQQMQAALRSWIIGARTVYVDRRAQESIISTTYAMTMPDSAAYTTLATYHRENDPYTRSARETVEIVVHAVVPVSEETWQIEWTETIKQRSGKVASAKQWQGTFTVAILPPTDERQVMINPLGNYVKQFTWTPRL